MKKNGAFQDGKSGLTLVILAMSGGVDSSVSAYLLKKSGYNVVGVFMRNWDDESANCPQENEWNDVQKVCKVLNIPSYRMNFAKDYWSEVFTPMLDGYEKGETPNPDIYCNSKIKFGSFYDSVFASRWKEFDIDGGNTDCFATGHHVQWDGKRLLRGHDTTKDQSFFLCRTRIEKLRNCVFPVGCMMKSQVKEIASNVFGLDFLTQKKESTGICFVGQKVKFSRFLSEYLSPVSGLIIDIETQKQIANHSGIFTLTTGQRVRDSNLNQKYFVVRKDLKSNSIYATQDPCHPCLNPFDLNLKDVSWINVPAQDLTHVRIRHMEQPVEIAQHRFLHDVLEVKLKKSVYAPAIGQTVALLKGEECVGGATLI